MMLKELSLLFAASDATTAYAELRRIAVEQNALLKDTLANRREVFKRLAQLYGLRREIVLYRGLRDLWVAESERPLLALLCAAARDPFLRATAPAVLDQREGTPVAPPGLQSAFENAYPDRYSEAVRRTVAQNAAATWAQAGHLVGKQRKVRSRAVCGPASTAYALLLGHLCGVRGTPLFETFWARILDAPPATLDAHAFTAAQRGWLDYRRIGDVAEFGFRYLLRAADGKIAGG